MPPSDALRAERHRLLATLDRLDDAEFDAGPTLCAEWSPRDVLGHVIGLDYLSTYVKWGQNLHDANQSQADRVRNMPRGRLMEWGRHWAAHPPLASRLAAPVLLLGDLGIHHQDVLRGLGRERVVPDDIATVIFREGLQLSLWLNRRVLRHRLVTTDGRRRAVGRGDEVHGTREALGMWLAGRDSVADELEFR